MDMKQYPIFQQCSIKKIGKIKWQKDPTIVIIIKKPKTTKQQKKSQPNKTQQPNKHQKQTTQEKPENPQIK